MASEAHLFPQTVQSPWIHSLISTSFLFTLPRASLFSVNPWEAHKFSQNGFLGELVCVAGRRMLTWKSFIRALINHALVSYCKLSLCHPEILELGRFKCSANIGPVMGKNEKCQPLINYIGGIVTVWSRVSDALPGSCWQCALAVVSWRDLHEHIAFPAAAISVPGLEAVNGRGLLGGLGFFLVFTFYFPFFLPMQPPQETVPESDCCSGGEEHSLLGSSVALTAAHGAVFLPWAFPQSLWEWQFHSFLLWLIKPRSLNSQIPSVPQLPW